MKVIHTECRLTHTTYDMTFNNGKLISICKTTGVASEEVRFYDPYLFEETIATFCHDDNARDFAELFLAMKGNDMYLTHAKEIIARELKSMETRVKLITSVESADK